MKKDFYKSLREKLNENHSFPLLYMFKFIIPSDNYKIARISSLFGEDTQLTLKESSKGKFTSVTARTVMISADEVIRKYQEASRIEGLIAL